MAFVCNRWLPQQEATRACSLERLCAVLTSFEELNLPRYLLQAVKELGYEVPTPIQVRAIPLVRAGGDLVAEAETGSGKTAAFALPILDKLSEGVGEAAPAAVQVLTLVPTRWMLHFDGPLTPTPEALKALRDQKRMFTVTIDALESAGFEAFGWAHAAGAPHETVRITGADVEYPHGGFLYDMIGDEHNFFALKRA